MTLGDMFRRVNEDQEVEQDIRAELNADQDIARGCFIGVTVDQGVAHLTGFAESYAQKLAIERAVSRVIGVRDVRDYLEVRPPDEGHREDFQIERAAQCALAWDARVPDGVRVQVTNGVLRLHGATGRFSQREAAAEAVRNLIGVCDVVNEIKLTPATVPVDLGFDVESAIRRRFGVACRHVWIIARDGVVTLSGMVPTFGMLDEVEHVVRSIRGVRRIDNQLLVA